MNYPGLSQTQLPETTMDPEYVGSLNPGEPMAYRPVAGRADRLGANVPDNFGGSYSNAAAPNLR